MPNKKTHMKIAALFGYPGGKVDSWMDQPLKTEGSLHRNYRHSPKELVDKYGVSHKLITGLIHIAADTEPDLRGIPFYVVESLDEINTPEARELCKEFFSTVFHEWFNILANLHKAVDETINGKELPKNPGLSIGTNFEDKVVFERTRSITPNEGLSANYNIYRHQDPPPERV